MIITGLNTINEIPDKTNEEMVIPSGLLCIGGDGEYNRPTLILSETYGKLYDNLSRTILMNMHDNVKTLGRKRIAILSDNRLISGEILHSIEKHKRIGNIDDIDYSVIDDISEISSMNPKQLISIVIWASNKDEVMSRIKEAERVPFIDVTPIYVATLISSNLYDDDVFEFDNMYDFRTIMIPSNIGES